MFNQISPEFLQTLTDSFIAVGILVFISIVARYLLIFLGQTWIKTFSHSATLVVLPIITFVITKVISGNIALSLGMVGALSIVRFRNPVKSPFELAVYFASITMGIAASVSLVWLLFFALSIGFALIIMVLIGGISKYIFQKPMFQTSFSEGNQLSTLEVTVKTEDKALMESEYLISCYTSGDNFVYALASNDIEKLKYVCQSFKGNSNIIGYQLSA